jgi:hypothetical protein
LTVEEMLLADWKHAERDYRSPDGKASQEQDTLKDALRPLRSLYSGTAAKDFATLQLYAVREDMIRSGLSRGVINARVHRIRRAFRWAASMELIPATVIVELREVPELARGRTEAPESPPVEPVPLEMVEATLPHLPRPVAAMVRLQLLTSCRAGEIMAMRGVAAAEKT